MSIANSRVLNEVREKSEGEAWLQSVVNSPLLNGLVEKLRAQAESRL